MSKEFTEEELAFLEDKLAQGEDEEEETGKTSRKAFFRRRAFWVWFFFLAPLVISSLILVATLSIQQVLGDGIAYLSSNESTAVRESLKASGFNWVDSFLLYYNNRNIFLLIVFGVSYALSFLCMFIGRRGANE